MQPAFRLDQSAATVVSSVIEEVVRTLAPRWHWARRDADVFEVARQFLWVEILTRLATLYAKRGRIPASLPNYCRKVLYPVAKRFFGDRAKFGYRHKEA